MRTSWKRYVRDSLADLQRGWATWHVGEWGMDKVGHALGFGTVFLALAWLHVGVAFFFTLLWAVYHEVFVDSRPHWWCERVLGTVWGKRLELTSSNTDVRIVRPIEPHDHPAATGVVVTAKVEGADVLDVVASVALPFLYTLWHYAT